MDHAVGGRLVERADDTVVRERVHRQGRGLDGLLVIEVELAVLVRRVLVLRRRGGRLVRRGGVLRRKGVSLLEAGEVKAVLLGLGDLPRLLRSVTAAAGGGIALLQLLPPRLVLSVLLVDLLPGLDAVLDLHPLVLAIYARVEVVGKAEVRILVLGRAVVKRIPVIRHGISALVVILLLVELAENRLVVLAHLRVRHVQEDLIRYLLLGLPHTESQIIHAVTGPCKQDRGSRDEEPFRGLSDGIHDVRHSVVFL